MEIGNQIKTLRAQRGVTQEAVAAALGVSAQAVSKWENGTTAPDISLLPAISAYFGVTIDELFALTDETRMERIRNTMWDQRDLDPAAAERDAAFLLDKARREPDNGQVWTMLAWMENHIAGTHRRRAERYAKEALARTPEDKDAHSELAEAAGIRCPDWYYGSHRRIIDWYKDFVERNPTDMRGYLWLIDALVEDDRLDEARAYCDGMAQVDRTFRTPMQRGRIAWRAGDHDRAVAIWEQMVRDFPDDWMAWSSLGDGYTMAGRYAEAIDCHQEAKQRQTAPRFTDSWEAIAQLRERLGDIPGAIRELEEEIAVMASDWDTTSGETVDAVRREIQRLKAKLGRRNGGQDS